VPFLTTKHSLDFCLSYAERAWQEGFRSLVVLGGDRTVGPPRCVNHAWELRREIAAHVPGLSLGGWANPHADTARQIGYLTDGTFNGEYFLTQVVSHHHRAAIERFQTEYQRQRVALPGVFGVFYYRSANEKTLEMLAQFLPVPIAQLKTEFAEGATPIDVCARTIRSLLDLGARHFYVSNLPAKKTAATLNTILEKAGVITYG
jgi:5,10-methylenetetrahydrofolate reductase